MSQEVISRLQKATGTLQGPGGWVGQGLGVEAGERLAQSSVWRFTRSCPATPTDVHFPDSSVDEDTHSNSKYAVSSELLTAAVTSPAATAPELSVREQGW